jgi:hypothetical protein
MPRYLELAAADPVVGDGRGPAGPSLPQRKFFDRKVTMSKLARVLVLGATLAAMNLAGLTAVASAKSTEEPISNQDGRRPPTQGQVGESYRHRQVAPESQTTTDPAAQRALARQRYWYYQSTLAARQAQARLQPPLESRVGEQYRTPSNAPVQPAEPSPEPNRPIALVGLLAAALALVGALVMMTISRTARKARVRQAV